MNQHQIQHDLQSFRTDEPRAADIDELLGQYERFVKAQKLDRANRLGPKAFFLALNFLLLLVYGFLAVQQQSGNSIPPASFYVPILGIGMCIFWWSLVKLFYALCRGKFHLVDDLRRGLLRRVIMMRSYWLLERIPLYDHTPPESVAAALPLTFLGLHILFAGMGSAVFV